MLSTLKKYKRKSKRFRKKSKQFRRKAKGKTMKTVRIDAVDSIERAYPYPFSKTKTDKSYFKRDSRTLHKSAVRAQRVAKEHGTQLYNDLDYVATQIYDHILKRYNKGTLQASQTELKGIMNKYNSIIRERDKKAILSKLDELLELEKEDELEDELSK